MLFRPKHKRSLKMINLVFKIDAMNDNFLLRNDLKSKKLKKVSENEV